jgi:hypothetical protein
MLPPWCLGGVSMSDGRYERELRTGAGGAGLRGGAGGWRGAARRGDTIKAEVYLRLLANRCLASRRGRRQRKEEARIVVLSTK